MIICITIICKQVQQISLSGKKTEFASYQGHGRHNLAHDLSKINTLRVLSLSDGLITCGYDPLVFPQACMKY